MLEFKNVLEIAKARNEKIDTYQEYKDAYEFYVDDGEISVGGAEKGCIIDKETGSIIPWVKYFMDADRDVVKVGEPKRVE